MIRRILSVSSSRADAGILAPVWQALAGDSRFELHVLLTGMHRAAGAMVPEIPAGAVRHVGGRDIGGSNLEAAEAMVEIARATGQLCAEINPDLLIVIGDRLDMIPAAVASLPFNTPIVHLAGGDLTRGAIDDRVRHALTKLSHVHCVNNVDAAYRIASMGEEPWRIHVTGATGLDTLAAAPSLAPEAFARELGLDGVGGLRLVTVHPETNAENGSAPLEAILPALDETPQPTLFTAPNSDPGGRAMRCRIEAFVAARPWAAFRDTLGSRLYANALRLATVMVGNSSSGIVEAALFGLNVINVGRRQEGRVCGANVHHCANDTSAVAALLRQLNTPATGRPTHSIYGDGRAARRVAQVVAALPERRKLLDKSFNNEPGTFSAPWTADAKLARSRMAGA